MMRGDREGDRMMGGGREGDRMMEEGGRVTG